MRTCNSNYSLQGKNHILLSASALVMAEIAAGLFNAEQIPLPTPALSADARLTVAKLHISNIQENCTLWAERPAVWSDYIWCCK